MAVLLYICSVNKHTSSIRMDGVSSDDIFGCARSTHGARSDDEPEFLRYTQSHTQCDFVPQGRFLDNRWLLLGKSSNGSHPLVAAA